MALNEFFSKQTLQLRQFLDGEDGVLRGILVAPDIRQLAMRWLLALDADEANPHMLIVTETPFHSADQFFTAALAELVAQNEAHRERLAAIEVDLPSPRDGVPLSARRRFRTYVTDLAKAIPAGLGRVAIVLLPNEVSDESQFRESMRFLAEATPAKFVVMDRLSDAILGSLADTEPQVSIQRFHLDPAEIERSVHDDLARGQLSPVETRRYTAMAGAFAAAHRRFDEAAEYQQRVLNLCQQDCPPAELAGACYDLANTQLALKQFAEAEANFNRAAQICLEHQIQPMLAMVLCNLGVVLQRQNRIDDALRSLDVARRTFSAIGNPPAEAHVLDCAARVLAQAGRRDEAEQAWRSALALYDGIDNPAMRDVREHGRDDLLEKLRRYLEQTGQAGKLAAIAAEVQR